MKKQRKISFNLSIQIINVDILLYKENRFWWEKMLHSSKQVACNCDIKFLCYILPLNKAKSFTDGVGLRVINNVELSLCGSGWGSAVDLPSLTLLTRKATFVAVTLVEQIRDQRHAISKIELEFINQSGRGARRPAVPIPAFFPVT